MTATVLADILVVIFVAVAWSASKGWTQQVPSRMQGIVESLGGFVYNMCKTTAGSNARLLFPLIATIFFFLLITNWMKLIPGVESVGVMHCAGHNSPDIGINITSGQPRIGNRLWVDSILSTGYDATEENYHACHEMLEGIVEAPSAAALAAAAETLREEETALLVGLDEQVEAGTITEEQRDEQVDALRLEVAEEVYPHAGIPLSADALEKGVIAYPHVVTPYVRGASTDLNLTFGLAIISFFAIQIFGVIALGPNYFQKFVNVSALGNAGKKPMGLMDFGVGLFEIISEIGKVISLSFRLFGNMFAGGILLAVMSFLVAFLLPGVFVGLELIVTTIQAYVFAVLTLVFSAQAMEGHHSDDLEVDGSHSH
jgi:F-type H+-transporting ATPase subunit a